MGKSENAKIINTCGSRRIRFPEMRQGYIVIPLPG
jgi:hypothetical protein